MEESNAQHHRLLPLLDLGQNPYFLEVIHMVLNLNRILDIVCEYTEQSPLNRVAELDNLKLFDSPLVAVADAADPLFDDLKKIGCNRTQS